MSLSRHTSRIYMDEFDICGALKVLADRIEEGGGAAPYYVGAHLVLNLINNHSEIRDQSVLLALFDNQLREHGVLAPEGE